MVLQEEETGGGSVLVRVGEGAGSMVFRSEFQVPAQHLAAAVQKRLGPQGEEDLVDTGAPKLGKSSELLMSGAWGGGEKQCCITAITGPLPSGDYCR